MEITMRKLFRVPAIAGLLMLAACSGASTASPSSPAAGGGSSAAASAPAASAPAASAPAASTPAESAASGGAGGAACATAPAGATATVNATIKDFAFAPQPIQAKVGDVIAWANQDSTAHSATLDNGACDTMPINPGSSGMLVFNTPGTFTYHCSVHPTQMKDYSIVVQ
jgi:plastocyanin